MLNLFDDFENQLERGKERANKVFNSKDLDIEDQLLSLHFFLSRHYSIPLFSPYFKERTIEELVLEVELIRLSKTPTQENTSALLNNATKEQKEELFDDWIEQDEPQISEADTKLFGDFMKTGEFKK